MGFFLGERDTHNTLQSNTGYWWVSVIKIRNGNESLLKRNSKNENNAAKS